MALTNEEKQTIKTAVALIERETNKDGDNVAVVDNAGAASIVTGTFSVGDQPFERAATGDGAASAASGCLDAIAESILAAVTDVAKENVS